MIAAIVAIAAVQTYFLISETLMTVRTMRGQDNSADRGTRTRIWILIAVSFAGSWFPVAFDFGRLLPLGIWLTWVGLFIMISGVVFRRYAIAVLGKYFTATVRIQKDHQMVKAGPYRYIRHPSYLGILILNLGVGLALANWISLLLCIVLPFIGIHQRIQVEEQELSRHFGESYQEYRKTTWRIIPYIY